MKSIALHFGESVRARIMGDEVRAEVLAVTRGLASVRVVEARRCGRLVGTTWAIKSAFLRRTVESGELFARESERRGDMPSLPACIKAKIGID